MRCWMTYLLLGAGAALLLLAALDPAAAAIPCFPRSLCQSTPQPAPGPLIGFGLPLAAAAVGALLAVRRFRQKD